MIHKKSALETAKMVSFSILTPLVIWAVFSAFSPMVIGIALAVAVLAYAVHGFYKFQVSLHELTEKK